MLKIAASDKNSGIIGVVGGKSTIRTFLLTLAEIFCVDDEKEASVLARVIGSNMQTVVVINDEMLRKYRQRFKDSHVPVRLLSLEGLVQYSQVDSDDQQLLSFPHCDAEGFIGYAANRFVT